MDSGSRHGFVPRKPKEKSGCVDFINMAGIGEYLKAMCIYNCPGFTPVLRRVD